MLKTLKPPSRFRLILLVRAHARKVLTPLNKIEAIYGEGANGGTHFWVNYYFFGQVSVN